MPKLFGEVVRNARAQDGIFDGVWISLRRKIVFYGGGKQFSGRLPNYQPTQCSFICPLTFVECHQALSNSIYKARLILFELKRKSFRLKSGKVRLEGAARELDEELVKNVQALKKGMERPCNIVDLLDRLFSAHLRLHPQFGGESGESPQKLTLVGRVVSDMQTDKLQASLLRVDITFRTQIIQPLKIALLDKSNQPDYWRLQTANRHIQWDAIEACLQWRNSVDKIGHEIMCMSMQSSHQ